MCLRESLRPWRSVSGRSHSIAKGLLAMRWAAAAVLRLRRARTSARSPATQPTPAAGPRLPSSFFLSLTCSLARVPPRKLPRLTNHWSRRLLLRKRFRGSVGLHSTQERCRAANERTIGRVREREPKPQSDQTWLLKRGAACCAPTVSAVVCSTRPLLRSLGTRLVWC